MPISEFHFFNMEKKHASFFANIILKKFCKYGTPRSEKKKQNKKKNKNKKKKQL